MYVIGSRRIDILREALLASIPEKTRLIKL